MAEVDLPVVNQAANEPSMSDIMASIQNIVNDDDSRPSQPLRPEVPPKTWLDVLADARSEEKAFVEEVQRLLGDAAPKFDLLPTTNVSYDGGSFALSDVKDDMRIARELGKLKHRGWYAGITATCANGACIEFKLYGPMDGEWNVNVRGGDCLVRTRKFTDRQELGDFILAVVPGLLTWKPPGGEWHEALPYGKDNTPVRTWLDILRDVRSASESKTVMITDILRATEPPSLLINSETMVYYDFHVFRLDAPDHDAEFAEELEDTALTYARTTVTAEIGKAGRLIISCNHSQKAISSGESWSVEVAGGDFRIRNRSFNDANAMSTFVRQAVGRLVGRRLSVVR